MTSGNGSSGSSSKLARSQLTNINTKKDNAVPSKKAETRGPLLPNKERDFFIPQNWSATSERKRDRSRDNFLEEEPEVSTLKPRTNNRRRILKKTDEKESSADDPYYCGFSAKTPKYNQQAVKLQQKHQQQQQLQQAGNKAVVEGGSMQTEKEKDSRKTPTRNRGDTRGPKYREPGVLGGPGVQTYGGGSQSAPNLAQIPQVQPYWWHSRIYPEVGGGMKGYGGYPSAYFDRQLPFTYTPNEFSSFQFSSHSGLGSQTPAAVARNGRKRVPANPRQNVFNGARD